MRVIKGILLLLGLIISVFAQDIFTNKDIIDLTKAGVAESIVIAKIRTAKTVFDTSTGALIELKNAGVSEPIIQEMLGLRPDSQANIKSVEAARKQISGFGDTRYFSVSYDRFKDITEASVKIDLSPKDTRFFPTAVIFSLHILSNFSGNGISKHLKDQALCVFSTDRDWKLLRNRALILLVDSNRIRLGDGSHDGDIKPYLVLETLCWSITEDQRDEILTATTLEFQLGNFESSISREKLNLFKQYKKLLLPVAYEEPVTFSLSDAVGKRKVFIETSDEQSQTKILKVLREKKFEPVDNLNDADFVIRFGVESSDLFTLGSASTLRQWGKLSVYLRTNNKEGLIFTKSKKPGTFGQMLHNQAYDMTEGFIKALLSLENFK